MSITFAQTITLQEYERFKERVLQTNLIRKSVPLSDIEIIDDTKISLKSLDDAELKITQGAFLQLVNSLGVETKSFNQFDSLFGKERNLALLKALKQTMIATGKSSQELTLVLSTEAKGIVGINTGSVAVTNATFFEMFESVMNNNPKLEVRSMHLSESGEVEINCVNTEWMFDIPDMVDEDMLPGFTFTNGDQTMVRPFAIRMICTNGMTGMRHEQGLQLSSNSETAIVEFLQKIHSLNNVKEFKSSFTSQVYLMNNTMASYRELHQAYSQVRNVMTVDEITKLQMLDSFFGLSEVRRAYNRSGIAIEQLSHKHQATAKTPIPIWEMLNAVTDIASHDYGFGISQSNNLMLLKYAGKMAFKPTYDLSYLVPAISF